MSTGDKPMDEVMNLPPVLDLAAAEDLLAGLRTAFESGRPLRLDASAVDTLTTPCLQIILAAINIDKSASIENPSMAFANSFRDLGLEWCAHAAEGVNLQPDLPAETKRILTVDDSKTMRDMLLVTLTDAGFDVFQAVDGLDAIDVLGDERVDVVITDINMPRMDGYGVIRSLRSDPIHKTTPILVLTTESDTEKKNLARDAGATGWMVKPFDPDSLVATVLKVLP